MADNQKHGRFGLLINGIQCEKPAQVAWKINVSFSFFKNPILAGQIKI